MGLLDDAKDKISGLIKGHEKQVEDGIDKTADAVEKKVGHGDTVDSVADKAKGVVDDLGK